MDKVNSPVGWWLRAISWVPDDGAVVQPSQNAVEVADSSFGDRVQVLGLRGVRHAADGVGGMLGWRPMAWTPSTRFGSTRLAAGGPNRPVSGCRAETARTRGPPSGTGNRRSDCFRDLWLLRRWNPCIDSETSSGSRIGACEHRYRRHAWILIVFLLFCNLRCNYSETITSPAAAQCVLPRSLVGSHQSSPGHVRSSRAGPNGLLLVSCGECCSSRARRALH